MTEFRSGFFMSDTPCNGRVLVVDDEPDIRKVVKMTLQKWPRVPIIVLTGFPDTDRATSFLRGGVIDYLVKPVEGEKLKAAVARAMEQRELARL